LSRLPKTQSGLPSVTSFKRLDRAQSHAQELTLVQRRAGTGGGAREDGYAKKGSTTVGRPLAAHRLTPNVLRTILRLVNRTLREIAELPAQREQQQSHGRNLVCQTWRPTPVTAAPSPRAPLRATASVRGNTAEAPTARQLWLRRGMRDIRALLGKRAAEKRGPSTTQV
jgi:hypothetical protein